MPPHTITTIDELEAIYGQPAGAAVWKEIDHINAEYRAFIEAAPFFVLASVGPEGGARTRMIPDRPGNTRIDSRRNIVRYPRVSLLFLIPGVGETFRVIGRASISTDPALLEGFVFAGQPPRALIIVDVERVYFQCSKAIIRSKLWETETKVDRKSLPSNGTIIAAITEGREGGDAYDQAYPGWEE